MPATERQSDRPPRQGLELDHDLTFERREWKVQKAGWVVMGVLVIAALLGAFGSGPLSHAVARDASGALSVEYDRFQRFQRETRLEVRIASPPPDGPLLIWIDRGFIQRYSVRSVSPRPGREAVLPSRVVYEFQAGDQGPFEIVFDLEPDRAGPAAARVGIENGPEVAFRSLIYR